MDPQTPPTPGRLAAVARLAGHLLAFRPLAGLRTYLAVAGAFGLAAYQASIGQYEAAATAFLAGLGLLGLRDQQPPTKNLAVMTDAAGTVELIAVRTAAVMAALFLAVATAAASPAEAFQPTTSPFGPGGAYATCDIPAERHVRNVGGSDGAGLCVFTSGQVAADWHQVPQLAGFQAWMRKRPGGGYPQKFDQMVAAYCREQSQPVPAYIQHTGGDIAILDLAIKTGRMPCITYAGVDNFYPGPIAHMVNLVHLDATRACIVDNNRPGQFVWMTRAELENRWLGMHDNGKPMFVRDGRGRAFQVGGGWCVVFLNSPPPPHLTKPTACVGPECPPVVNYGIDLPLAPGNAAPVETNFGIDLEKVSAARLYSFSGQATTRAVVEAALADDSDRLHLTAVGETAAKALADALPQLAEGDRARLHIQTYAADDWEVKAFGLKPGVQVRGAGRVAGELRFVDPYTATAAGVVKEAVRLVLHPDAIPAPMPPAPTPPGPPAPPLPAPLDRVTITLDDLIEPTRALLKSRGVDFFKVTVELVPAK